MKILDQYNRNFFKQKSDKLHPRLWDFIELIRLDKPIGVYLLLWPTMWALWVAGEGSVDIKIIVIFLCGVILMRSAGCAINDFADRHLDGAVARTKNRPLVTGKIRAIEALACAGFLVIIAFILVLQVNTLTVYWSMGALAIASIYPFMKRYTYLPQVVLGAAFAWSVPMAFTALTEEVPRNAWLLYFSTVFWTIAYDTMYAMVDREDDIKIGIKSTAILFGNADKTMIGGFQVAALIPLLILGANLGFGWLYYIGLLAAVLLFLYQQFLIREREPEACFIAFKNNHWVGTVVFIGILLNYLVST